MTEVISVADAKKMGIKVAEKVLTNAKEAAKPGEKKLPGIASKEEKKVAGNKENQGEAKKPVGVAA